MRHFSRKQKAILKDYARHGYFEDDMLINRYGNKDVLMKVLENVNDYETMWSDLDRIINDLMFTNSLEEKYRLIESFR